MLPDESRPARPQGPRGQGEVLLLELQHPAPHDSRHKRPAGQPDGYADREDPRLEDGHRQDGDHQVRYAVQDLDDALHDVVHPTPEKPGDRPVRDTYEYVQESGQETDIERYPRPRPHPRPHVPAELVGTKPVLGRRPEEAAGEILAVERVRREQRT